MSLHFFPTLWTIVTLLFWVAVAVLAVVRKDQGRWWMLIAGGAGLLAVMAVVDRILWWAFTKTWGYDATAAGLLTSVTSLISFVGLALVVAGAFLDRARSTSTPTGPGMAGPGAAGGPSAPPSPAAPPPYPQR